MKRIILLDFERNRTGKTKRWLGLLTFCMMLFVGQQGFAQYCVPEFASGCGGGDEIDSFEIPTASFSHLNTGCSADAYEDFTDVNDMPPIPMYIGSDYDFTITHGYGTQRVRIWIDFNNDEVFDDSTSSTERVALFSSIGTGTGSTSTEGTIVIPANVSPGSYRMRVATRFSSQPVPCNTDGYGEIHDYTVQISPAPPCAFAPVALTATNITMNNAVLEWTEPTTATSWDIEYGISGFTPSGTPTISGVTNPYTLGGLAAYTQYDVYVRSNCGGGDVSPWTMAPFTFKTLYDCTSYAGDITSVTGGGICDEGTATLQATASGTGNEIYWYDAEVGGNLLGQGTSFTTPNLTETTSYWVAEMQLGTQLFTEQGSLETTTLGSTTNGGIQIVLNQTASILSFEARSTTATGGAVTYRLIDMDNGNSVLMEHEDVLPGGGTATAPVLYTVNLNFLNIPPGNYRLIKSAGAASAYLTGSFPYPLGTVGQVINGAGGATSTSTLYYHFFNITIEGVEILCESDREEVTATVHEIIGANISATTTTVNPGDSTTLTASSTNSNYTYVWEPVASIAGSNTAASVTTTTLNAHTTFTVTATDTVTGCQTTAEIEILVFDTTLCNTLDIATTTDGAVCDEGIITLGATASGTGNEIYWYDAEVGGNLLGQGTSFVTPSLTETTSYWASEVLLDDTILTGQGNLSPTTLGSTTNGGIQIVLNKTTSIFSFEARSTTAAGGAVTYRLIDMDNGNSVLMEHEDVLPGGGTATAPVLYTVNLNFLNIPPGNYRLIKSAGAASAYMTGAFPYPLGTVGQVVNGAASATSTSTLNYHFFNLTIEDSMVLCESDREEVTATVHHPVAVMATSSAVPTNAVAPNGSTTLTASSTNDPNYTYVWEPAALIAGSNTGASVTTAALTEHTTFTVTATDTVTGCTTSSEIEILVFDITDCDDLEILTATGGTVCNEGTVTLAATASGTGDAIIWFDAATGGNIVGEGTTFETPVLTETTSYWAAETVIGGGTLTGQGKPAMTLTPVSGTSTSGVNWGHVFDAYEGFTIAEADMYSTGAGGDITIQIQTHPGGIMVDEVTVTVPGGGTATAPVLFTSVLNLEVPEAGTYRMLRTSSTPATVNMVRESSSNTYPYPLGTSGSITGGWIAGTASSTAYYWFYNLKVTTSIVLCESDREVVIATVNAPAVPTGDANQDVAEGSTLANLDVTASGTLTWYADAALTTVLLDTEVVAETTYYVTNTEAGCESAALAVTVTTYDPCLGVTIPTTIIASATEVCGETPITLETPVVTLSYCNSNFSDVTYEHITNVTFGDINNSSGGNTGGPVDYTSQVADVTVGTASILSVSILADGGDYIYAWIDWNQDGDFDDAGETYTLVSNTDSNGPHTLSITPPADALNGNTRMRVMVRWSSSAPTPNPCVSATYGEAEDYTVNVTGGVNAGYTYSWSDGTTEVGTSPSLTVTPTATTTYTLTVTDLSNGCTDSEDVEIVFNPAPVEPVAVNCWDNFVLNQATCEWDNVGTAPVIPTDITASATEVCEGTSVTLETPVVTPSPYCTVAFSDAVEPITLVQFAGINNATSATIDGTPALQDFTAMVGNVTAGATAVPITLNGNTDGNFTNHFWVYIDWNQNGVFTDAGETYFIGSIYGNNGSGTPLAGSIDVPAMALNGDTRMRVLKKFNAATDPGSCNTTGTTHYGQAEDYTVNVTGGVGPYTYSWSDGTTEVGTSPSLTVTPTATTTYTLTVTDLSNGCSDSEDVVITVNPVPAQPTPVNCWDDFQFDTASCTWENVGTEPIEPTAVNCWDDFVFNTTTCDWENVGTQPAQPTDLECYESATFNDVTCMWDITGTAPATPTADSPQNLSVGQTVADIVVTNVLGTLNWYDNNGNSISDSLVLTEGTYTFWVSQTIDGCESDTVQIDVEVTLSTKGFDNASFRAYPNPVQDFFNVSYSKDITNIAVINMLGQTVITQTVNATDTQIDMTSLPTGSYFVKVTADGAVKTVKVIKK